MSRINSTFSYPFKTTVSGTDYVIGTNSTTGTLTTVNFQMSDIKTFIFSTAATNQDNFTVQGALTGNSSGVIVKGFTVGNLLTASSALKVEATSVFASNAIFGTLVTFSSYVDIEKELTVENLITASSALKVEATSVFASNAQFDAAVTMSTGLTAKNLVTTSTAITTTPTVSASIGTLTSTQYLSDLKYSILGQSLDFIVSVTITEATTASGYLQVSMPFNNTNSYEVQFVGREQAVIGVPLLGFITAGSSLLKISKMADLSTIISTGYQSVITGSYRTT